jgi:hypothetical protein
MRRLAPVIENKWIKGAALAGSAYAGYEGAKEFPAIYEKFKNSDGFVDFAKSMTK